MFKLNSRNTTASCEICSTLTIKTLERRHWPRSGVFIVNFEPISHLVLVFLLLTLSRQMPTGWTKYLEQSKEIKQNIMVTESFDNCVKSVRIRSYSGPHFPYSARMRENVGPE